MRTSTFAFTMQVKNRKKKIISEMSLPVSDKSKQQCLPRGHPKKEGLTRKQGAFLGSWFCCIMENITCLKQKIKCINNACS